MKSKKSLFLLILIGLSLIGGWGIHNIINQHTAPKHIVEHNDRSIPNIDNQPKQIINSDAITPKPSSLFAQELTAIAALIRQGQFNAALNQVDQLYSQLSNKELEQIKQLVLASAKRLSANSDNENAFALLQRYTASFDDMDAWYSLSQTAFTLKKWSEAVQAMLRSTAQEYRHEELESKLTELVTQANHLRNVLESQKDELGIRQLYQTLYDQHSNHPRFQLELAQSHIRLGDIDSAIPLLEILQYDVEFAALAKQKLAKIEADQKANNHEQQQKSTTPKNPGIVVPLQRSGNSFFINVSLNAKPLTMLLDTGASITALSKSAIRQLKLQPTGQSLQLHTANGVTQSRLYRAKRLKIGRFTINNALIAEIDMEQTSRFSGLLGTDVLNQIDNNYSYLIDNQRNALIFKRK